MTRDEELLLEQVVSAHRRRRADGSVASHPAWHDLNDDGRREAFEQTLLQRKLEAAIDADGLSTTARALLGRIERAG
jgi:hypothetical protein